MNESLFNYEEEDRERENAKPANDHYTGEPCVRCKRIRVYLRCDGQTQCEKCDLVTPAPSEDQTP